MSSLLRAGVARAITTPPVGITHGNWGAQTHTRAEGVDLDLWATALVLEQGGTQVAISQVFCRGSLTSARVLSRRLIAGDGSLVV